MWTMGWSDGSGLHTSDSCSDRRGCPLMPRTTSGAPGTTSSSCASRIHGRHLFPLHDYFGATEQSRRESIGNPVSSRWNPTPEQLVALEELYRCGTHTPTADQIRHITTELRRYGKIEGKNVFYWFQNHKARERQKRRRQAEAAAEVERHAEILERKDSVFQIQGYKSWSPPRNCSNLTELSHSNSRLQIPSSPNRCNTWEMMHLSGHSLAHLKNNNPITTLSVITTATTTTNPASSKPMILNRGDFNVDNEHGQSQTLELFPLRSDGVIAEEKMQKTGTPTGTDFGSCRFFQFLPLKN